MWGNVCVYIYIYTKLRCFWLSPFISLLSLQLKCAVRALLHSSTLYTAVLYIPFFLTSFCISLLQDFANIFKWEFLYCFINLIDPWRLTLMFFCAVLPCRNLCSYKKFLYLIQGEMSSPAASAYHSSTGRLTHSHTIHSSHATRMWFPE